MSLVDVQSPPPESDAWSIGTWFSRKLDVRAGEGRIVALAFALLFLLISAHTILETARDALLLRRFSPSALGVVYIAVAACVLPGAALAVAAGRRFGARIALAMSLILAAAAVAVLFVIPTSDASIVVLYVVSGLIGAVLVTQFWTFMGSLLTVGQARRLLGPIASAGVLGGVLGSAAAAAAVGVLKIKALLPVSAGAFLVVAGLLVFSRSTKGPCSPFAKPASVPEPAPPKTASALSAFRGEPFLVRVALAVGLSTATFIAVDYLFKWSIAQTVPRAEIGAFVARSYAVFNAASLLVQLFVGGALVRRLGVGKAIMVTPALLFLGAGGAVLAGGAMLAVLIMKGLDGSLRYSIHRITTELVYLPVPAAPRERAKPFIDGALARAAQAATGVTLLALGEAGLLSTTVLAIVVVVLALGWLAAALSLRRGYLGLLRRTVAAGGRSKDGPDPIDLASAEVLVEYLASDDPSEVIAAMRVLARRGRARLIPALVLLHDDEQVLVCALEILSASPRTDWFSLGRRLLTHANDAVRIAAARALVRQGALDIARLADDTAASIQGYAALHAALRDTTHELEDDPSIVSLLALRGEPGDSARLGVLAGMADSPPTPRISPLLLTLAEDGRGKSSAEWSQLLAGAAERQHEERLIPFLVERLSIRAGREAVRKALVTLGDPAYDAAWKALADPTQSRSLRLQLPMTLARFGTKRAAEALLRGIETWDDGLLRYKAIRALGRLVADFDVRVDRVRAEKLSLANLAEHLRLLGLRVALDARPSDGTRDSHLRAPTERLLVGLLDDKLRQSLERAFRLLKIAHPREDIHRVQIAAVSDDKHARANACEFLDALLTRRDQQRLRGAMRLVADDLPIADRVARAASFLERPAPHTADEALLTLIDDRDVTVAALATLHASSAAAADDVTLRAAALAARRRPEVERAAVRLFEDSIGAEAAHA